MSFGDKLRDAIEKVRSKVLIDDSAVKEMTLNIQRALISADVEVSLVRDLSKKIEALSRKELPGGLSRKEFLLKNTYDLLAGILGGHPEFPEKPRRILLVGLFGSGKTTTAGKLARYYSKRGMKTGVIAADVYRPAAFEQLKQTAEKADVAFYGIKGETDASKVVRQGIKELSKCDLLICDSAGRSGLDEELRKEIVGIKKTFSPEQTWLVIGADIGQLAKKQAEAFNESVSVNGVIITRMDGSAKGGGALAACASTGANVYFLGTGEKLEDLQPFDPERYLGRVMGYGDLAALLEKAKEAGEEETLELEELMAKEFNLDTFYRQLKAARKMGPLGKVLEMMGLSRQIPKELVEVSEEKLNRFGHIIDSMAKKEKLNPDILNRSRIERISKGSGSSEAEVRELIKQYKVMAKMFSKFKGIDEEKLQQGNIEGLMKKFGMPKKRKKFKIR
jgi:signal recognition particle subunit SRP54